MLFLLKIGILYDESIFPDCADEVLLTMPLYEFKCRGCGDLFEELFSSIAAAQQACCPRCRSREVERLISACAFASKGNNGEVSRSSSSGHSCGSCSSHDCSHCH